MYISNTKPTNFYLLFILTLIFSCSSGEDSESPLPEPPTNATCEGAISVTLQEIGSNYLNLSWNTNGDFSEFDIEYGADGFAIGQGTRIQAGTTSIELQNLEPNSEYDIYVRGVCSNTNGDWTNKLSFTTQCNMEYYEGDITLYTQDDVNTFGEMCYSGVKGSLSIRGYADNSESPKITDLSPLANLQEVTGFISIANNEALENLSGLEGLKRVGHLYLNSNKKLYSIEALSGLEEIYGEMTLYSNQDTEGIAINFCPALKSLEGLHNITSVVRLTIMSNDSLENLNGLRGLKTISVHATIEGNPLLTSMAGLNQLESVGHRLKIRQLNSLVSLEGLEMLKIVGQFDIEVNESLISLSAISNLQSVDEFDIIGNNLENLDGINLDIVKEDFFLETRVLKNLNGILGTSTTSNLRIYFSSLISLNGLETLESAKSIEISANSQLTDLSGLEGLRSIDDRIYIGMNNQLSNFCALDGLINIGGFSGEWSVEKNPLNPSLEDMQNGICN
ncbi:fibronectin type III domain-containing protein [Flagellimonas lutimaris]|uniref:fibronectin type III domain-containing protein n=1 Tax=Flagellimonas lutimaris TaxID=475082 RepID=UPI003F5CF78B